MAKQEYLGKSVYIHSLGMGLGVFWYVWDLYGFWWGLWYGINWQAWIGYRMAEWLLRSN